MPEPAAAGVVIVDYGMGNLFSVEHACREVGLDAVVTDDPDQVATAAGVILPGVGAMPDAMAALSAAGLDAALREVVAAGKPLWGICLGMHLLLEEGTEFGSHPGLGIIPGRVVGFDSPMHEGRRLKVPQVGWNEVRRPETAVEGPRDPWRGTPLEGLGSGEHMYFVHSYFAEPADPEMILAVTEYGHTRFASAIRNENVFACQFHPERSGAVGLRMYANFARLLSSDRRSAAV